MCRLFVSLDCYRSGQYGYLQTKTTMHVMSMQIDYRHGACLNLQITGGPIQYTEKITFLLEPLARH